MTPSASSLRSFAPDFLLRRLQARGSLPAGPASSPEPVAVLLADLAGFTTLTDQLAYRGPEGAELISDLLDPVLGRFLGVIGEHGGAPTSLAGDSVIAVWPAGNPTRLEAATRAAAHCGLALQETARSLEVNGEPARLSVSIGAGTAHALEVGGYRDRWHAVLAGPPLDQLGEVQPDVAPGQVTLSASAYAAIGDAAQGKSTPSGSFLLTDVEEAPQSWTVEQAPDLDAADLLLEHYVPSQVLDPRAPEIRPVTALFVNLLALDLSSEKAIRKLHAGVGAVQEVLDRLEGTFCKLSVDDKGPTIVAAFGLPPFAHEEDASRAAQAAVEIRNLLHEMRVEFGIGIATGRAYCGAYGNDFHREYSILGSIVNLAARLMQAGRNDVLCDRATVGASRRRVHFSPMPPISVRGLASPVPVYRLLWEADPTDHRMELFEEQIRTKVFGRDEELRMLASPVEQLTGTRTSSVVVIEGGAGIGKSVLGAEIAEMALSAGAETVIGGGDAAESSTPYFAWRAIFEQVLDLWTEVGKAERRERVMERLQPWPELVPLAPLLNGVLHLDFSETDITRAMSGSMRRDSTSDLLMRLLDSAAGDAPLVVVLDDAHWLDSASWELVRSAIGSMAPLLLVIATRPMNDPPAVLTELGEWETTLHIRLEALQPGFAVDMVCDKLKIDHLPEPVADLIIDRAEGHPFYSEELAYQLRDAGIIEISGGRCRLNVPPEDLWKLDVPDTVQGLITSRLDRLAPQELQSLQVASVLGRGFDFETLRAVHPAHPTMEELRLQLDHLDKLDLISHEGDGSYAFKHSITQEAAYQVQSFKERRALHRTIAEFQETLLDREGSAIYPLLAYHWAAAQDPHRALQYLEASGSAALDRGASREAAHFYERVISLDLEQGALFAEVTARRRAHWHTQLGLARAAVGDLDGAARSYHSGLILLGQQVPRRQASMSLRLLWETLRQLGHLLAGTARRRKDRPDSQAIGQAARICSLLGEVAWFQSDLVGYPLFNLLSINLAEKAGRPSAAGLAYSSFSYLVASLRLIGLADRYNELARVAETEAAATQRAEWDPLMVPLGPGHKVAAGNSRASYLMCLNRWEETLPLLDEAVEACRLLRDDYTLGISLTLRSIAHSCVSPLDAQVADLDELLASARKRANSQHEAWAVTLSVPVLISQGRFEELRTRLDEGRRVMDRADPMTAPIFDSVDALAQMQLGEREEALIALEKAVDGYGYAPAFPNLVGFRAALETSLSLWDSTQRSDPAQSRGVAIHTKRILQKLRWLAAFYPFARPSAGLYRGRAMWIQGRARAARRLWLRALRRSARAGLLWDEARLHYWLSRLPDNGEGSTRLATARRLFERLGVSYEPGSLGDLLGDASAVGSGIADSPR